MSEPKYPDFEPMPDRIRVHGMTWFDRVNGNTYHSAWVTCAYGDDRLDTHAVPFQYGYDQQYLQSAYETLISKGVLPELRHKWGTYPLWTACHELGIDLEHDVREGTKRQTVAWGEAYA